MNSTSQEQKKVFPFEFPAVSSISLSQNLIRAAELCARMLLGRARFPNYYSIEVDETLDEYTLLSEIDSRLQLAMADPTVHHICVQAHYLLPVGDGDVNLTLFLFDE